MRRLSVGLQKAARVCELKADDQIVGLAPALAGLLVRPHEDFAKLRQVLFVLLNDDELVRIRATIRADGHRLAAKNQFRPALAEPLPTAANFLRRAAGRRAIPPFHRLHRPAVADAFAVDVTASMGCVSGDVLPVMISSSHGSFTPSEAMCLRNSSTVLRDGMRTNLSGSGINQFLVAAEVTRLICSRFSQSLLTSAATNQRWTPPKNVK